MPDNTIERGKVVAHNWAATASARLLDELLATTKRYVIFPDEHAAVATALWITATHALPAFECAPRLIATSPEKRCGKTRLLDVITGTCHRPLATSNASVAAIFRSIGVDHPPTVILDEADTVFGTKKVAEQNEDLRALLNAGHQRGRPALRCVGPNQIPTEFSTFAMAAIGGIGTMPDTVTDRGVNITMRRRMPGEQVSQFRSRRDGKVLDALRERLAAWANDNIDRLRQAEPDMPVEDRAADTWEPLIAVADAVGGDWPVTARAACLALVKAAAAADEDRSTKTRLLADIRTVFTERSAYFMPSGDLVNALRFIDEAPWGEFDLNASKLAFRLRDFGVKPGRDTTGRIRGYRLEAFHDAFMRYLRQDSSDPSETHDDQDQPSDTQNPSDTPTRQTQTARQTELPDQTQFLTPLTGSDGVPAEDGQKPTPAAMPLRRTAPTTEPHPMTPRQRERTRGKHRPPRCTCGGLAPARSDTGLCDWCTAKKRTTA